MSLVKNGRVKWFNNAKGFGFVIVDGVDEDLFAHYSTIQMEGYKTLKAGQPVTCEVIQGPKGLHATNIKVIVLEDAAPLVHTHARITEPH